MEFSFALTTDAQGTVTQIGGEPAWLSPASQAILI
jgi:hypothetical protein